MAGAVITVIIGSFGVYWSVEEIQCEAGEPRQRQTKAECPTTTKVATAAAISIQRQYDIRTLTRTWYVFDP